MSDQSNEIKNIVEPKNFLGNVALQQNGHVEAEGHVQRGCGLFEQERYEEARIEFEAARAAYEQDPETHNWLGQVALRQRRYPEAEAHFRRAFELKSDEPVYPYNLGLALREQKRWGDAETAYRAVLKLKPDDDTAHVGLGACLFEQGHYDEARTEFETARAANEQDPHTHNWLGRVALKQNRDPEAEAHFRRAIELKSDEPVYHYNLGLALREQKRWSDAETAYRAALKLKPGDDTAHVGLGTCLFEQEHYDEARTEFEMARAANEHDPETHNWLGRVALKQNRDPDAEADFRRAIELKPDEPVYHYNLGLALREQKRWGDAETAYRAVLKLKPDDYTAHLGLGTCLFEQEHYDEARTEFEKARAANEQDPETHNWLGRVALKQNRDPEAEAHFRRAIELKSDEPVYHYNLGLALENQKRWSDAEAEFRAALAHKADYYPARIELGASLFQQERYEGARTEFELARQANEQDPETHNWLGTVALKQDRQREAGDYFRKASNLKPEEPSYHFSLASVLQQLKRYDEAMAEFEQCVAHAPQSPDASFLAYSYHNVAWGLAKQGRFGRSLENWRRAVSEYEAGAKEAEKRTDAAYFGYLGTIAYAALRNVARAQTALEYGRKLDPDNVDILSNLVELYLEKSDDSPEGFTPGQRDERSKAYWSAVDAYDRAKELLSKTLEKEAAGTPKHAEALVKLAKLLLGMREYDQARDHLTHLLAREREGSIVKSMFVDAHSAMGVVSMRQERFEEAAQHFELALRLDPDELVQRSNLAEAYLKSKRVEKAEIEYRKILAITEDSVEALIGLGEVYTAMADAGDPDLYDVAIDYFSRGYRTAQSESRSKWLRRKEEAALLYSRGYARVRWVESAKPRAANHALKDALDDFKHCRVLDPEHYKAERAVKKVGDWLGHSVPEQVEKYGPSIIFGLSLLVFFGSQLGFYLATPPKNQSYLGYWALATFGSLLFMIAGLYLPQLLKIKVAGIELEKSSVDQVATPVALHITR
jgi:tetratricopeptide (TPR) repeat protein